MEGFRVDRTHVKRNAYFTPYLKGLLEDEAKRHRRRVILLGVNLPTDIHVYHLYFSVHSYILLLFVPY